MKEAGGHFEERPAWAKIEGKWQSIYGSFRQEGVSIEWHDFATDADLDWSLSFHDRSVEVCLNYGGEGVWVDGDSLHTLHPHQVGLYSGAQSHWQAFRRAASAHRFITLEFSPEFLGKTLGVGLEGVRADIRQFIESPEKPKPLLHIQPMGVGLLGLRAGLLEPAVSRTARPLWYASKINELLAQLFFDAEQVDELFCDRNKRLNKERAEQAAYLLRRDLANPPSLEMLAGEVGCSSFHLSRVFAQEIGLTIPRYLRISRIEKAGELLKAGGSSVTEVAFRVGYSSLSAFNQAFVEITGCCPGLYPTVQRLTHPRPKRK